MVRCAGSTLSYRSTCTIKITRLQTVMGKSLQIRYSVCFEAQQIVDVMHAKYFGGTVIGHMLYPKLRTSREL